MRKKRVPGKPVDTNALFGIRPLKWKLNGRTPSWQGWWSQTPFAVYTIDRWKDAEGKWSDWTSEVSCGGTKIDVATGGKSIFAARLACAGHWRKTLLTVLMPNTVRSGPEPAAGSGYAGATGSGNKETT